MDPAKVLYEQAIAEIDINHSQKGIATSKSAGLSKLFISTETYKTRVLAAYAKHHESPTSGSKTVSPQGTGVYADTTATLSSTTDESDSDVTHTDESYDSDSSFVSSQSSGCKKNKQKKINEGENVLEHKEKSKSETDIDKNSQKSNSSSIETKLERHSKPDNTALNQFIRELKAEQYTSTDSESSFVANLRSMLSLSKCEARIHQSEAAAKREFSLFEIIDTEECWSTWDYENQPNKLPLLESIEQRLHEHPTKSLIRVTFGKIHFNCHRIILRYAKLFQMLKHKTYEFPAIQKVTAVAFVHFYQFAMGIRPKIEAKYFLDILKVAEVLNVPLLRQYCMQLLDSPLYHEYNAFVIFKAAKQNSHLTMQRLMLQRIWKFFMPFVATRYFLELDANDICSFLSADSVGVNSEIEIFFAAVLWLSSNWKNRKGKALERVMKCVRFGLLPPWFTYSLRRGTGMEEVDRILASKCVNKMVEDGASIAATIGLYFVEPSKFESILNRLLPKVPKQRAWVFDKHCTYHYGAHEKVSEAVDFVVFKDYLKILEMEGPNYWRNFQEAKDHHLVHIFSQKFSDLAWSNMRF